MTSDEYKEREVARRIAYLASLMVDGADGSFSARQCAASLFALGRLGTDPVPVQFVRTHPKAVLPTQGTQDAVGFDLYAALDEEVFLKPGTRALIPTGFNIAVPFGYEAQVRSRSGLALKNGVMVLNSPGTIDPDYRGSLGVILYNSDREVGYIVKPGARIAQLVVAPVTPAAMIEVEAFEDDTARGTGGYGSTGT